MHTRSFGNRLVYIHIVNLKTKEISMDFFVEVLFICIILKNHICNKMYASDWLGILNELFGTYINIGLHRYKKDRLLSFLSKDFIIKYIFTYARTSTKYFL